MSPEPDGSPWVDLHRPPLSGPALAAALTAGPDPAWRRIEVVTRTGSTNADVADRAVAGEPEGLVLVAEHQDAGRGRLARSWVAPPRSALTVSVLLRPDGVPPARRGWLSPLAALAVRDVLLRRCGLPATLKWPNDVLVGERKVCGVLAEVAGGAVVLGAGLNVTQTEAELPVPTATSLLLAGSAVTDRDTLLRAYLRALADRYTRWVAGRSFAAEYREACATIGRRVRVEVTAGPDGRLEALADGVDDDGRLMLRADDGSQTAVAAADVVHVRPA